MNTLWCSCFGCKMEHNFNIFTISYNKNNEHRGSDSHLNSPASVQLTAVLQNNSDIKWRHSCSRCLGSVMVHSTGRQKEVNPLGWVFLCYRKSIWILDLGPSHWSTGTLKVAAERHYGLWLSSKLVHWNNLISREAQWEKSSQWSAAGKHRDYPPHSIWIGPR